MFSSMPTAVWTGRRVSRPESRHVDHWAAADQTPLQRYFAQRPCVIKSPNLGALGCNPKLFNRTSWHYYIGMRPLNKGLGAPNSLTFNTVDTCPARTAELPSTSQRGLPRPSLRERQQAHCHSFAKFLRRFKVKAPYHTIPSANNNCRDSKPNPVTEIPPSYMVIGPL
jgi:hypothetical protein